MSKTPKAELMDAEELEFHFEKGFFFRVIHVDGAFGGVTPSGQNIHMAVYSERQPIPRKVAHSVTAGVLGPEIKEKRDGRSGVFREVEADLVFDMNTAIALRTWLDDKITEVQKVREVAAAAMESQKARGQKQ